MTEYRGSTAVERVLGGTPVGVLVRLLVMSFVVGIILNALDVDPTDLLVWLERRVRDISELGFGSLERALSILVLGAVVVVPAWLIFRALRLMGR